MKSKTVLHIIFFCMVAAVFAEDGIVKIGNHIFDEGAIVSAMKTNNTPDPFTAIQALKRREMAGQLAEKRKLDMSDPEKSLYSSVTGEDLGKDRSIKNTPDIPLAIKKPANLRVGLFEQWIADLAEKNVPVYILNNNKLWEIFKQTDSYKVRAEHGHALKPEDAIYTWADLSVDPSEILASRRGKPFIKGDEFNAYLKRNTSALNLLGKRGKSHAQVRGDIARLIVAGNLIAEELRKSKEQLTDIEIERAVSRCTRKNILNDDFDLKGLQAQTLSEYREILNKRSMENIKAKIGDLREVLKGNAQCADNDYEIKTLVMHAAFSHSEAQIVKSIQDNEAYEWMKEKKFKGSLKEARLLMAEERQQKHINDLIAAEEVVFNIK